MQLQPKAEGPKEQPGELGWSSRSRTEAGLGLEPSKAECTEQLGKARETLGKGPGTGKRHQLRGLAGGS